MLKIILPGMHDSLLATKWEWTQWMFLFFLVSGTCSLVTVHQPPVLTAALGHDVIMPCQLKLSDNEKMLTPPVLYWVYLTEDADKPRLWTPSEKYEGRVDLLDNNQLSLNKSILFKNVQWADSGKYLCKLSVTTDKENSFRTRGNETLLLVYGTMTFNLTPHHDSLLCEVNVTSDPAFVLSIFHDGRKLQSVPSASGGVVAAQPYVTLSDNVSPKGQGKYECQLHLNEELITERIFHYRLVSSEVGAAEKNVTDSTTVSEPSDGVFPEPWCLYVALLLVPIAILLGIFTFLLMCRRRS